MSEGEQRAAAPRVLFFGLPSGISAAVLGELIAEGTQLVGVVVASGSVPHLVPDNTRPITRLESHISPGLPMAGQPTAADTLGVAWAAGLPVWAVGQFDHPDSLAALAEAAADVAVVACFNRRIPAELLRLPRYGFLNLHPSLLPAYRGPAPLFWQLRDGAQTGVTVHFMDEGLDTGDIAARAAVALLDGMAGPDAERWLMLAGRELLSDVLADIGRGVVRRQPQPPGGSYFGHPEPGDFGLSTDWTARRAFNFMCGTAEYGRPYAVEVAGETFQLAVVKGFSPDQELDLPCVRRGRSILIRFNPGTINARMIR